MAKDPVSIRFRHDGGEGEGRKITGSQEEQQLFQKGGCCFWNWQESVWYRIEELAGSVFEV